MRPVDAPLGEEEAKRLMDELRSAIGAPPEDLVELVRQRLAPGYEVLAPVPCPGRSRPGHRAVPHPSTELPPAAPMSRSRRRSRARCRSGPIDPRGNRIARPTSW
jgi:hypothetical protein